MSRTLLSSSDLNDTSAPERLRATLAPLRRRALAIDGGAWLGWALLAAIGLMVVAAWIDLVFELPGTVRLLSVIAAAAVLLAVLLRGLSRAARESRPSSLARILDRASDTKGQILTGVDLAAAMDDLRNGPAGRTIRTELPISAGLAQLAVQRATRLAAAVPKGNALPLRTLMRSGGLLAGLILMLALLRLLSPDLVATEWMRFLDPAGDHPPYSKVVFNVEPGNASVVYGGNLDIRVTTSGEAVERLELVLRGNDGNAAAANGSAEDVVPMFAESNGAWRVTLSSVIAPMQYYVRGRPNRNARSSLYKVSVITAPNLEEVRFRISPPPYTHRNPYEGPLPPGGLSGLPGTQITVWAKSNRPLASGKLQFNVDVSSAHDSQPVEMAMMPLAPQAAEVTGSAVIEHSGRLSISITDIAGQNCQHPFSVPVIAIHDARPFVRLLEPKPKSYATPSTVLPVQMIAEDDYGISRLQLFRSLNDSRALPKEVSVSPSQPSRLQASLQLPLKDYGLVPGDFIKLYAHVEDNDPAGAKDADSAAAIVQIISEEDMQRMTLAQDAMDVLQSKYAAAERRLEAGRDALQKLEQELASRDAKDPATDEDRQKLEKEADDLDEKAAEIEKEMKEQLPLDLDKKLQEQLEKAAQAMRDAAKELRDLGKTPQLDVGKQRDKLKQIQQQLNAQAGQFQQNVMLPLEFLAKIFPLIEDQERFIQIDQQQRSLEQRMAVIQGGEKDAAHPVVEDDPQLKADLRDLEDEQRQLRDDLRQLLDDITAHVQQLPDDSRLNDFHQTAEQFAKDVRESGAAEKMADAESALDDFSVVSAHTAAEDAANILDRFVTRANGVGQAANGALKFQPVLNDDLGDTVAQLLGAEGLNPGQAGQNGSGGYAMRRHTLNNIGLYGAHPRQDARAGGGASPNGMFDSRHPGQVPDNGETEASSHVRAGGSSDAPVPVQYKRRVGEYFQRVADELGQR